MDVLTIARGSSGSAASPQPRLAAHHGNEGPSRCVEAGRTLSFSSVNSTLGILLKEAVPLLSDSVHLGSDLGL